MNAPMQPDAPDWLVELLGEHHALRDEGTEQVVCWCLWKPETRLYGFAEWDAVRAHVAAVIWTEFAERVGEAFADPDMDDYYEQPLLDALGADDD